LIHFVVEKALQYKTIFISDLHLGTKKCKEKKILKFLKEIKCDNLYLVGDIIDGWALSRKHYWTITQTEILRKILKMSETTNITYIPGNHDSFVRPFFRYDFSFSNIRIVEHDTYVDSNGRRIFVVHGDKYDFWMKVPKKIINFLAHFTDWVEISEETGHDIKRAARLTRVEKVLKKFIKSNSKYDAVICGHTHHPKIDDVYMNTGDWVKHCTALCENYDGSWKIVVYK
jgi:UDP-2,3-diacylglucosamine pyrophosphatase LpxH